MKFIVTGFYGNKDFIKDMFPDAVMIEKSDPKEADCWEVEIPDLIKFLEEQSLKYNPFSVRIRPKRDNVWFMYINIINVGWGQC